MEENFDVIKEEYLALKESQIESDYKVNGLLPPHKGVWCLTSVFGVAGSTRGAHPTQRPMGLVLAYHCREASRALRGALPANSSSPRFHS